MDQKYLAYYFRNLCVHTFQSYATHTDNDLCIYDHFLKLLHRLRDTREEWNILVFVNTYLKKIDDDKYRKKLEAESLKGYDTAKDDFLKVLSNTYQITLIYNHKDNLARLEEKLLSLNNDRLEKLRTVYNLNENTINFIKTVIVSLKNALSGKIDLKYDINEYDKALSNTFLSVEKKLDHLKIEDILLKENTYLDENRRKVFEDSKEKAIDHLGTLSANIEDTFSNNRKIRHLKSARYYLSFLLHDEISSLEGSGKIFKNLHKALIYAYKMQIYFLYFNAENENITLTEILAFFNDEPLTVGTDYDRGMERTFFSIVDNIEVRNGFKHLALIFLGYQLSLDAKTVEKISIQLDNSGYTYNKRIKNINVASRFKDLKYTANVHRIYDLDEDTRESLEFFNSYQTQTVYEANVVDENGEVEKMSFGSEEDYISYITPQCDEEDIRYIVDNFLRRKNKKIYYEPLFEIGL